VNIILSILIILSAFTGQAPAPISEAPVEQVAQTPIPQVLGLDWLSYELALSGAVVPENVVISLTNESNCGAELSTVGVGGCTHWLPSGVAYITVSPELAWTASGNHILHHELGHVVLDTHDECAVEAYAHSYTTATLWSYPECEESPTA
jgi:hypothetical protein